MEKNKTGKYLKYAVSEIVLVVIGILIAISINNWNENRKNDEVRRTYYVQILQDLEKDKILMEESNKRTDSFLVRLQNYKEIFRKPDLPLWEIVGRMANVYKTDDDWNIETNTNTITTLQSTGDIKLIPPILRNKILDLKHKQFGIKDYTKTQAEALINSYTLTSTLYGGTDLARRAGNQPKLLQYYSQENIKIQILMGLEALLDGFLLLHTNGKKRFTKLILDIEEITKLINEEIKK